MYFLKLAVRTLARRRGGYLATAAILSLGIAMSVAMFSLVDAVLLRPLPFPHQENLHLVWKADPLAGKHVEELAYPELRDLQGIRGFESVAVMPTSLYGYARVLQTDHSEPVQIESAPVSHDFFRVLGVSPALGRDFIDSDERVGAAPVVILSHQVWRDHFAADPRVIGRMIRLNGAGHTVIGVMARGVEFPRGAGLWIPLGVDARIVERRGATFLQAIVRARIPRDEIGRDVNALFKRLAAEFPENYSRSQQGIVTPLVEYWTGSARLHLWIMLGASILLLAASTLASTNLLVSSTLARRSEIATRLALGATSRQILAQLGAEGVVVATVAASLGLAIAEATIRFLVRFAPPDIPRLPDAALNLVGFCFATAAAALAAIACTVVPGLSVTARSRRNDRTRNWFVLAQSMVTVTLLALAVLLTLSYRSMMTTDTGFANRDALTMNLQLRSPGDSKSRKSFYTRLLNKLREAPGVTSAAAVLLRPLEGTIGWDVSYEFEFEAGSKDSRVLPKANYEVVTPDYFRTIGTALVEGRDFDERDSEDGEPVLIISRTLAERIRAAGHDPLGHRVRLGLGQHWCKVIGISADARYRSITQSGADVFVPYLQAAASTNYVVIRGARPELVRRTLAEIDPNQAIADVATIGELIDKNAARHRFNMALLLWFALCSAILAAAAVYSVIAETVAERRRDIAIRNALGAQRVRLVRETISRLLAYVVFGEVFGALIALRLGSAASELLFGISASDPLVLGSVAVFLFAISAWARSGRLGPRRVAIRSGRFALYPRSLLIAIAIAIFTLA